MGMPLAIDASGAGKRSYRRSASGPGCAAARHRSARAPLWHGSWGSRRPRKDLSVSRTLKRLKVQKLSYWTSAVHTVRASRVFDVDFVPGSRATQALGVAEAAYCCLAAPRGIAIAVSSPARIRASSVANDLVRRTRLICAR